jgi:hypothetical protein
LALAYIAVRRLDVGPWYSEAALLIVIPFLLTFVVYGPVMFLQAAMASGARGYFVAQVLARVLATALVLFGGLLLSGLYTEDRAGQLGGVFVAVALVYVNFKLRRK